MKKQFLTFFTVLLALTNWLHTANAQPTTLITPPSGKQTGVFFDVTVTFSEAVTGFEQDELVVTSTTDNLLGDGRAAATITAWTAQVGGTNYVATITPIHDGTVSFNVAADVAQDADHKGNTAATEQTVDVSIPETVWMPDANLRTLVRKTMGIKPTFSLSQVKIRRTSVTALNDVRNPYDPTDPKVRELKGLEYALNLKDLTLRGHRHISNLTPLQHLRLDSLNVDNNNISNLTPLESMTSLTTLSVQSHRISNLTSLQNLTNLRILVLDNNNISDVTPIRNIRLTNAHLNHNDISDTTQFAGWTWLDKLYLYNNPFTSLFPTVEIIVPAKPQRGAFNVTMRFSEDVTGFEQADLSVSGAAATITEWDEVTAEREYTATITPTEEGNVTLTIAKGAAQGKRKQTLRNLKRSKSSMKIYLYSVADEASLSQLDDPNDRATETVDTTRPGVDITVPDTPQSGAFEVTVVFNEPVTDFVQSELTVSGAGASITTWTPVNGREQYTAEITPTEEGTVTLSVAENVAEDAAGNLNTASPSRTVEIDMTPPSVTITGVPTTPQNSAFDVTITFSKDVTGFVAADIALANSTDTGDTADAAATLKDDGDDNDATYTATITPTGTGSLKIQVLANAAVDAANNGNTASSTHTVGVDADPPTVTITGVPTTPQNSAFDVTITFSEDVTGFAAADIAFSNSGGTDTADATATLKDDSDDNDATYTATITPTGTGSLSIQVPENVAVDAANNGNTASDTHIVDVDTVRPTVTITNVPTTVQGIAFDVTITFSEAVTGFTASDITFSGTGTADATATLSGTGTTYTATITPTGNGVLSFQVPENVAVDAANNGNTASTVRSTNLTPAQQAITIDITRPSVTITGIPSTTQNSAFDVTITFSEDVTGFVAADIALAKSTDTGDTADAAATLKDDGDDNDATYTATITPTGTGSLKIQVLANAAVDAANNGNTASSTHTVGVDADPPTVTITGVPTTPQNSAFDVTITFSEDVTGFTADDIAFTNSGGTDTVVATATVTGSGKTYTATITPTGEGTLGIQVPADAAVDVASNGNTVSAKHTVEVDTARPGVTITGVPATTQNTAFTVTITFSATVTGFTDSDIALSNSGVTTDTASATATVTGTGTTYTATLTPSGEGTLTIQVPADAAFNSENKGNVASAVHTVVVDADPPTVTITGVPTTPQNSAFDVAITFSEDVTGFTADDIAFTNSGGTDTAAATATLKDDSDDNDATYAATITPTGTGSLKIQVPANAADDTVGNGNTASDTRTVDVDTVRPTVTITKGSTTAQGIAFDVTITFSEAVTGFTASDITFSGTGTADATATLSGTGTTYTATITPTGNGVLSFQVPENVAVDAANNGNTASTVRGTDSTPGQQTITIDTTRPSVTITGIPSTTQNSAFDVTITFSEDVTGFVAADIAFANSTDTGDTADAAATLKDDSDDNDATYTATITPTGTGSLKIQVLANTAVDAANNGNTASSTHTVAVDADPPTVTITGAPSTPQNSAFDVTITFSEDVTGFAAADIAFTNSDETGDTAAATATLKADSDDNDATYTATITPTGTGSLKIQVLANAVVDAANNGNTASSTHTVGVDADPPTVTITGAPSTPQNSAFDVTITFSEDVTGFTADDIAFTNSGGTDTAAATATVTGTGTTYTATITPTGTGSLKVQVPKDAAVDAANNGNTASAKSTVDVDTVRPTVTITKGSTTVQGIAFDVTITFSEAVTGFTASDITFSGTDTADATATLSGTGTTYTATITPTGNGVLSFQVPENVAVDAANNGNTASTVRGTDSTPGQQTITIDTTRPSVTITGIPSTTQNSAFDVTITFSEDVTGFVAADIAFANSTDTGDTADAAATLKDDGDDNDATYTATITPTGTGSLKIQVLANAAVDAANNGNTASSTHTVGVDADPPTVTITGVPTTPQNSAFDVTITFSEDVTGFATADIAFSNSGGTDTATATATVTGTDTTYTATITPTGTGSLSIQVPKDAAVDATNNGNTASSTHTVGVDADPPTVTITGAPSTIQNSAFNVTITFSEDVTGFAAADIAFSNSGGPDTAAATATVTGTGTTYTATITPTGTGSLKVQVPANAAVDAANNGNTASSTHTVDVDTVRPTVTITNVPTPPQGIAFDVTITFSETVTGFTASDIALTGTDTATATATVTGTGTTYTATITPTGTGSLKVQVPANAAVDAANNGNTASSTHTVDVDTVRPTVTITNVPTPPQGIAFDVTITFSETVTGFTASDIALTGTDTATATATVTGTGTTYTATITPTGTGSLSIQVPANAAVDAANNGNTASSTHTVAVDADPPTVTITGAPSTPQNSAFDVTITFSEDVTGFTADDIAFTNSGGTDTAAATATLKADGDDNDATYTATITPTGTGSLSIQVPKDMAMDAVNNGNTASSTHTVAVDADPPTVTITGAPSTPQNSAFDVTITFSEDVTGFAAADIAFSNSGGTDTATATATVTGTGTTYTATITPTGTGSLSIQVPKDMAMDAVNNGNTASDIHTVGVDADPPTVTITGVPTTPQNSAFDVTITFSEDVTGFAAADIAFTNSGETGDTAAAAATLKADSDDNDATYTATITPTGTGSLSIQVPKDMAMDAVNNGNTASSTHTVGVDVDPPTVTITGAPSTPQNSAFDVTITFSEDVTGFAAADIAFTNSGGTDTADATATLKDDSDDNDATYTATITPTGTGSLSIQVPANAAVDAVNNGNTASAKSTVSVDTVAPTVTITDVPDTIQNSAFDVTITFSETVTGFTASDIALTGTDTADATATVTGTGTTYTATITPTGTGSLSIQVPAEAVVDVGSNQNTASAKSTVSVDTVPPTVTITGVPDTIQNSAFDVTITFSETVTGFTASDIALTGADTADATATVTGTGTTYTAIITPTGTGSLSIQVSADVVMDAGSNPNTASVKSTVPVDTVAPTVTITGVPGTIQNSAFDVTITFSETVTGFTASDIALTGTDTATAAATLKDDSDDNDATYTATITPTGTGSLSIQVPANAAVDAGSNPNTASAKSTVPVDTVAPTVTITGVPNTIQNSAFDVTITFSEVVTGFTAADLTLTATGTASATAPVSGNGSAYTATITPTGEGEIGIQVPASVAQDIGTNDNTASAAHTVQVDTVPPTVTITDLPTDVPNNAFDVTITFSEDVTGFTAADLTLTATGTATATAAVSGNGSVYTATITPTGEGEIGIQVLASVAQDIGTNDNIASAAHTVQVDTVPPTVTITDVPTDVPNNAFDVTITFSEDVTGFTAADLTLTATGTASATATVSGNGSVYTATITPTGEGEIGIQVPASVTQDIGTNDNTASAAHTVQVDTVPPTVTITDVPADVPNNAFDVTITFSEDVTGFTAADLTLTTPGTTTATVRRNGSAYTATITPTGEGTVTVQVPASVGQDIGTNDNTASNTAQVQVDTIPPTVTITDAPDTIQNEAFNVTITFSEDVTDFEATDLALTGTADATATVSGNGSVYTATITPTGEGTVTVQVPASVGQDIGTNDNTASNTVEVQVDTIPPTVTITDAPDTIQNGVFSVTITFSEDVTGFTTTDIALTGTGTADATATVSGNGSAYTATLTPTGEGTVTVQVPADAATDVGRNGNTPSNTAAVQVDTIPPTVTITDVPDTIQNGTFAVTITFREDVIDFTAADIAVTHTDTASTTVTVSGSGSTYIAQITPAGTGTVTVQVPENVAEDFGGNPNTASAEHTIGVDVVRPTVTITDVPSSVQSTPFSVTVIFSEDVTEFINTDIELTRTGTADATVSLTGSGSTYTATLTPTGEGNIGIQLPENVAVDRGGNMNTASIQQVVRVDTVRPSVRIIDVPEFVPSGTFSVTVIFDENVTGFADTDIAFTGTGTVDATATVAGSGNIYTVEITPAGTGNLTVQVPAAVAVDAGGNLNTASETYTIGVDANRPSATITDVPQTIQTGVFSVTVTFSEDVTGFIATDLVLTPTGTADATVSLTGSGSTYTATLTPTGEGELGIQVPEHVATDSGDNLNTASNTVLVQVDTERPSVTITALPTAVQSGAFAVSITFSEEVTGFTDADLAVTVTDTAGATVTVTGSGSTYTAQITPAGTGSLTVQVPENVATDAGGNLNTPSASHSIGVDATRPSVTITDVPQTIQTGVFSVTMTFSEDVTGFIATDIALTSTSTASATVRLTGSGSTYAAQITPVGTGSLTVQVPENAVADAEGNLNTASELHSIEVDTDRPTVTITDVPQTIQTGVFSVTVTFSEDVTEFIDTDIALTLTDTARATVRLTGSGNTYTAQITPAGTGSVSIQVPENAAADAGGNLNTASAAHSIEVDVARPTVTITDVPQTIQTGAFSVSITFSEDVIGFTATDITLTGPGTADTAITLTGSGRTYTATFSLIRGAAVGIQVRENVAADIGGNLNTASATHSVEIDTGRPTATITDVPPTTQNSVFAVTVTFSEDVTGFTATDLSLTPTGTASAGVTVTGSGSTYTAQITPAGTGSLTVQVPENVATDAGGNLNTASAAHSIEIDATRPSVRITDVPETLQTGVFSVTVTFSEDMTGFTATDLTLTPTGTAGATVTVTGSGSTYTTQITPTGTGSLTIQVPENVATDGEGNLNTASTVHTVGVDTDRPSVTITDVPKALQTDVFSVTLTFSEDVTGFTATDLTLTSTGTASATVTVTGSGSIYTAQITPAETGSLSIQVPENAATDISGNLSTASAAHSIEIDATRPSARITDVPQTIQTGVFSVTVTFSKDMTGFTATDLLVTPTGTAEVTVTVTGSGSHYTAEITPTGEGEFRIQVPENVATDSGGNLNTASNTALVQVDTVRPTVTITDVPPTTQNSVFAVTVTFSEAVTGFTADDIALTTTDTETATATVTGSGTTYTAQITPTGPGQFTVQVPENVATDSGGNLNTASNTAQVQVDAVRPTVTITDVPTTTQNSVFAVTVTFSEAVTGFTADDIALTATGTGTATATVTGSGTTYTTTITPTGDGVLGIQVLENVAVDARGNLNTTSNTAQVQVDAVRPTVTITDVPTTTQNSVFAVTVTFSEAVTGFTADDIALTATGTGTATATVTGSGTTYTTTITPTGDGVLGIQVPENVAVDAGGNLNTASNTAQVQVDTTPPSVSIRVPEDVQDDAFEITVLFSEPVTGFSQVELAVTGVSATITNWAPQPDRARYIAQITPAEDIDGIVTFTIAENVAEDDAGNPNTVALQQTVQVDSFIPPTIFGVEVTIQHTNPDSDPDINDLDSDGNHVDGPLVGAPMGNITATAYTPYRTSPVTDKVRFEVRRKDGTEWMAVETIDMESAVIVAQALPASVVQKWVATVAEGTPTVSIPDRYRKWMLEMDTTTLDDTITKDDAAGGRDVRIDENPYIIRAVAIAGGADHMGSGRVHDSFSVDNVDDVAPLERTIIFTVSDHGGMLTASNAGVFTVGGIVDEAILAPMVMLTAKPRAHVKTFDHIKLVVNVRNANGTLGDTVDVGEVVFEHLEGYSYTVTLDVSDLANAEYGFQGLAVDKAMNVEKKIDSVATSTDVENYTPPPDSVTTMDWTDDTEKDVATITEAYPRGYLVTKLFTFTLVAAGIHPPEIDVMLGGSSTRDAGLLTVEQTNDGGGGLADPRTFVVTLDTSSTPDGKYMLTGVITKRNGSSDFGLPMLNIDSTGPMVEMISPKYGHELSPLPTIRVTFTDGIGSGVVASSNTIMLELVRLMSGGESVDIPINQDEVDKPDGYIVEDNPNTPMVEASTGDLVYTSPDVLPGGAYELTVKVTDILGNTTNMGRGVTVDFTIVGTLLAVSIQSPISGQILDYKDPEIIVVYSGVGTEVTSFTLNNAAGEAVAVNDPVMVSDPAQLDNNKMSYMPTEPLADGKYTAVVTVGDANGEVAKDAVTFTVSADDTTPAVITQVSPQGVVKSDSATLSVQAYDEQSGVATVTLSLNEGDAVEGETLAVTGLVSGTQTVDAVVTNGAGLETTFRWTFTVVLDTTPPEISSVTPQGLVQTADVMLSAVVVDDQSAITSVTIAVDGGDATPVAEADIQAGTISQAVTGLESGTHSATIVAMSDGGSTSHIWTFTVMLDTTAPEISAVAPQGVVREANVMLSAVVVDEQSAITSVMIAVDGGAATPVAEANIQAGKIGQAITGLESGTHTAEIVATSDGGSTTHSWTFTVMLDTTAPEISAVAPQGIVEQETTLISAVVVDEQSPVTSVTIAIDGGEPVDVPEADIQSGNISMELGDLKSGTYAVEIVATSSGGSRTHSWTFTVRLDTTPPEISAVAPQGLIRDDTVSISAVVVDEQSALESVTIALDDGAPIAVATVDIQNGRVGRDVLGLTTGTHTVTITATSAGGTTAHAWTFTVELDEKPPTITSTGPHGLVRKERPVVSVVATDDLSGVDTIEITLADSSGKKVTGETAQDRTSATFIPENAFTDDTQGTYVAKATVKDVRGNEASVQWAFTVEFDTIPPVITTATPQGEARITERKPLISAAYTDDASGIDTKSVKLWVDGKPVTPTKVTTSQVTYLPIADLNYGRRTVKLEVSDLATRKPNKTTHEWSFYVEAKTTRIVDARPIPNPFKDSTTITFTLSRQSRVTVELYDMSSRLVRTLVRGRMYDVGDASKIVWDGKTDTGEDLARGVYFCRLVLDSELTPESKVLKLALTR